ncbi:MAG: esterase [Spirochaetales bacterium]|nr:esterase [Spirochaetales bacterium]
MIFAGPVVKSVMLVCFRRPVLLLLALSPGLFCGRPRVDLGPNDIEGTLTHAGQEREYILHSPRPEPAGRVPLVLVLHGGGGDMRGMLSLTGGRFQELADQHGFYVLYPQGLEKSWNDGRLDPNSYAHQNQIDDIGFLTRLIEDISFRYPIDQARIFSTGISNGGFMSMRLACQLSERVRGIAAVTAQLARDQLEFCHPARPVSVLLINGTEDPLVPYDGGQVRVFGSDRGEVLSTRETYDFWRHANACPVASRESDLPDTAQDSTTAHRFDSGPCRDGSFVSLIRIQGGGHTWPGGWQYFPESLIGRTSRDFQAADLIWKFFEEISTTP